MGLEIKILDANFTKFFNVASPLALPNIHSFFRADDEPLGALASFTDLSGNGHHLTQAVAAAQPINTAAQLNGHAGVITDGVDDFMTAAFTVAEPWEIWAIYAPLSYAGVAILFEGTSNLWTTIYQTSTSNIRTAAGGTAFNNTVALGTFHSLRVFGNVTTAASEVIVDNGVPTVGTITRPLNGLTFGAYPSGANPSNMSLIEVFIVTAATTATEKAMINAYYNNRYNLGL